jgi:ribonuclease D
MSERLITDQREFDELCSHIREAGLVAFDTEFISENTYRPKLCLIQLATRERAVAVDPFEVDVSDWWNIMTDDQTTVVVHAGREESRFCLTFTGKRPRLLVDVQLAEGLRSSSYPLSYERLLQRVLNQSVSSTETRTDWQRRPLTDRQISYAVDDVRYVLEVWDRQKAWLQKKNRLAWAEEEFDRLLDEMEAERDGGQWMKLSGVRRLNSRQLAVVRELYRWREETAASRDQPMRRILRDDLLIDLARRQPKTEQELLNSRDMNRTNFRRNAGEIVAAIKTALDLPQNEIPPRFRNNDSGPDEPVLGKLLALALANRCAELQLSAGIVGTANDLKEWIRWYGDGSKPNKAPRLSNGWRAEVCGDLLRDVLEGKVSLRVADTNSEHPLVFERVES